MIRKKKVIEIAIFLLLILSITACSGKNIAQNQMKESEEIDETDETEEEEVNYREGSRVYRVLSEQEVTQEEMEDLLYKIQKRVEVYSTEAEVSAHTDTETGEKLIEIYIPEVVISDEDFAQIVSEVTLEFISDYGTERQKVWLTNEHIENVEAIVNDSTGIKDYGVKITFNEEGKELFAQATSELIGEKLTIVYDGNAISAPVIQAVITDGVAQITGLSSVEESENMAAVLRISNLKIELEEIPNPNGTQER